MPRFFFHVHDHAITLDEEGVELADLEAVRLRAREYARDLAADEVRHGHLGLRHRIEVEDEQGRPVFMMPLAAAIKVDD